MVIVCLLNRTNRKTYPPCSHYYSLKSIDVDDFDYNIEPPAITPNDTDLLEDKQKNNTESAIHSPPTKKRKAGPLKASAGHDLSPNANSMMTCYIDTIMELMWHCLLPRTDMEFLDTKSVFDNMLKKTFELILASPRCDASDRMKIFIF